MSERTHSPETVVTTKPRKKLVPVVAGTAILLVTAGVGLQFLRPQPAASQTAQAQDSSRSSLSTAGNSAKPLAKVNGQSITYDVVARECVSRYGQEVLGTMINRLIIEQECEKRGLTVSIQEVEQEVANTAKKFNLPVDTWYKMLESERKLTRTQYQQDIIWPMIALKKLAGADIKVSEDDMRIGFEREYGPRVKARLILVDGNMRQASQIWDKCQENPDEFDRIAREFSTDANSRPLGGVVPPIRKHGGMPQVEEQAFRMSVGEISPLIQVQESRYVILKCEGFTDPVVTEIRDVWDELYVQLVEEKTQQSVAKVFEGIKTQSRVDNFLTNQSMGAQPGSGIQPTSGTAGAGMPRSVTPANASRPGPATR